METRSVHYGELRPCRTAFIDAHTPSSDQKENYTIIGGGVSESADPHVHITETPGVNISSPKTPKLVGWSWARTASCMTAKGADLARGLIWPRRCSELIL